MGLLNDVDTLVKPTAAVRKFRTTKHDFKDGHGRVPAHRHINGGGWVANTAQVAPSVFVGRNAQVGRYARVTDRCQLKSHAVVTDGARLSGNVIVDGAARVYQHATVFGVSVRITGNAHICGNAVVYNTVNGEETDIGNGVLVCGSATVVNSTAWANTRILGAMLITDKAHVQSTALRGVCVIVKGTAQLYDTTVTDARVEDNALVRNSIIGTSRHPRSGALWQGVMQSAEQSAELQTRLLCVQGSVINSTLILPEHSQILQTAQLTLCSFRWYNTDETAWTCSEPNLFDFSASSWAQFAQAAIARERIAAPTVEAPVPIAVDGPPPSTTIDDALPRRRLCVTERA